MSSECILTAIKSELNEAQIRAVTHQDGPLLVLAGPGSGKTRVITFRIAYLMTLGVSPYNILGLTFTNKAAREMIQRVEKLVPQKGLWLSTYHAFCAKILRRQGSLLGYNPDFSIYDVDDQKRALKYVLETIKVDLPLKPEAARQFISNCKNKAMMPEEALQGVYGKRKKTLAKIYHSYQEVLKNNNALDFDDLLLKTLELFSNYKDVLSYYQEKFRYILIDEFQDTNLPQYKMACLLGKSHRNVCATGDPDQSIYSWRGANINNILSFEKDFANALVIKLEQNYRSTKKILEAASSVISNNRLRKEKTLWTDNPSGESIRILEALDDNREAQHIGDEIKEWRKSGRSLNDIVIFYRTNAQSRVFETALRNRDIPYVIVGGLEFYKRAEVKDIMAYLRVLVNPSDNISLLRIINTPTRGIGKTTCNKLIRAAADENVSMWQALHHDSVLESFATGTRKKLDHFVKIMEAIDIAAHTSLVTLIESVLDKTGYLDFIKAQDVDKNEKREDNIKEFLTSAYEYQQQFGEYSLTQFLERISLIADVDQFQQDETEGKVTLMTLHAAKGLEFPIVYIVGLVEGLLPHFRSDTYEVFEEERRLMFVGLTRAKSFLTLSYAGISYRQGYAAQNTPTRFLSEIPRGLYQFNQISY